MQAGRKSRVWVLTVLAAASGAWAQNTTQPTPPPSVGSPVTGAPPKRTLESSTEMRQLTPLKLTDDQITKLRPLVDDEGAELSAVRLDEHLTPDQRRERSQEIRSVYRPRVIAILTPEQQAKWKQMDEAVPAKPEASKSNGTAPAAPRKQ